MDLKQQQIHRTYKKCEAKNQITLGNDYSVPEGKPDVAKILQKRAELSVDEVHAEKGKVKIKGILKVWVFYLAQRSSRTADSFLVEIPFDEMLYMEGACSGDHLKVDWLIEELKIGIIHPGKLDIRCVLQLCATVTGSEIYEITEDVEKEDCIHRKIKKYMAAEAALDKKDSYRIRDEVSLLPGSPNVERMLWYSLQLRGLDIRLQEDRMAIKGECQFFTIYEGEEDSSKLQWFEQSIPFTGMLDVNGLKAGMFGSLETEISHQSVELKPDYDGELRSFQIEMMLDIHMNLYEEQTISVLLDAYSTKEQVDLQKKEIICEKLRMCNETKCRVNEKQKVESESKILQILGNCAELTNKRYRVQEEGILCEGMLNVQILYVSANDLDSMGSMSVEIPYGQLVEIPGIQKEDNWKVVECIDQIYVAMQDSETVDVKGVMNFQVCVLEPLMIDNVTAAESSAYDQEIYKGRPGMTIHFVKPNETLWELAKAYWTTTEAICELNELPQNEVSPGQKLLLLKDPLEPAL